jgi:hypothetical protein
MSRKSNLLKFHSVIDGSMTGNITSPVTSIHWLDNVGVQLNFTGTPTGTFFVDVSADYTQDTNGTVIDAGNWVPITLPSTPVASGAAGSIFIDLNQLAAPWIRVRYVATSSTGILNAFVTGKLI